MEKILSTEEMVQKLVTESTTRASRFAMLKVGKWVEIRVDLDSTGNVVEVSWPSIGSQPANQAAFFANELLVAAEVAAETDKRLKAR